MRSIANISFFAVLLATVSSGSAVGQVDPNLQVRIETLTPQRDTKPDLPQTEVVTRTKLQTYTTTEKVQLTDDQRQKRLESVLAAKDIKLIQGINETNKESLYKTYGILPYETKKVVKKKAVTETVEVPKPRQTTVTAAASTQALFDTNATKTPAKVSDWVLGSVGTLTVNVPVGTLDNFIVQTGVSDQRYAKLVAKDVDIFINNAQYNQVLNLYKGETDGTTTSDVMSYALSSSTVYGKNFKPYLVELFTPSVAWARNNIDLGGTTCGPKGKETFCIGGTFIASGDVTFSDAANQRNTSVKLLGSVLWQTSVPSFTVTTTGFVQAKHFTDTPGGRDDLILFGQARADWYASANVQLSGAVQVTQQFSTVKTQEWNGLAAYPYLKLKVTF
ncbi:hypothetical protein IVA79_26000 [Bradyrhizobium sp. 138]|uniref:hypothetical protein n=1 Tax=Bradyrhizobium sp. 138 TaxID=2782615 RepID=UPI001FF8BA2C|nr:hypothetical protein [Bradyrhizobium sp. 138]MCK1737340.1 hypothetical protein [Bradyrhizobium sp. 138]